MKALDKDGLDYVVDKIYDVVNSGGSADYIVEEGTSGIWTYRKWASGIAECWGNSAQTVDVNTAWGHLYLGWLADISLPSGLFTNIATVVGTADAGSGMWIDMRIVTNPTTVGGYAYINVSKTALEVNVRMIVKGLWKTFTPSVMKSATLDTYYPVGSIYISANASFDPNVTFGGTWELMSNNFLVGAGDDYTLGDTGGSADHQHRVGMQYVGYYYDTNLEQYGILDMTGGATNVLGTKTYVTGSYNVNNASTESSKTRSTNRFTQIGKTEEADNLPPYQAVNMWLRTA